MLKRPNPIAVANEKVPIATACRLLGVDLDDDADRRKVHCPFGGTDHSDGGIDPAMRIYTDSNHAYCFSCAAHYTPVSLAARGWDLPWRVAALRLLDLVGYRPLNLATAFRAAQQFEPAPDTAALAEALKTYCRRIDPGWSTHQFDSAVAQRLTHCLGLLELVSTGAAVTVWLAGCKEAMRRIIPPQ